MNRGQVRRMVKRDAKEALQGHWGTAIGMMLVGYCCVAAASSLLGAFGKTGWVFIPGGGLFTMIAMLLVTSPLLFGFYSWCVKRLRGQEAQFDELFSWFKGGNRFTASVFGHGFLVLVRYFAWVVTGLVSMVLLFFLLLVTRALPGVISLFRSLYSGMQGFGFYENWPSSGEMQYLLRYLVQYALPITATVLVAAILCFGIAIFLLRYQPLYNIIIDDPQTPMREVIRESKQVMRGHIWDMIWFYLSFIGWYLLVPFTFGLILLYVAPYRASAKLLYIEYLRDLNHGAAQGAASEQSV